MGVKSRKLRGKWYPVFDYRCGKRKTRVIGTDRKIAEEARRSLARKIDPPLLLASRGPRKWIGLMQGWRRRLKQDANARS